MADADGKTRNGSLQLAVDALMVDFAEPEAAAVRAWLRPARRHH
jgi:hypothetical protein